MNLQRIWELLTGSPHIHANADMVKDATNSLSQRTQEFENAIKPYSEAEDPLVMFMTDLFNKRSSGGTAGSNDGKTKLYP